MQQQTGTPPPAPWTPAPQAPARGRRARRRGLPRPVPTAVARPLERFLRHEAASASLLIAAAAAALLWANLGPGSYERAWTAPLRLDVAGFTLEEDVRHVVNELLMAVFFYVVALEVKRELVSGALRDARTAAVPAAAALGTMIGAAATYLAINAGGDMRGWAIPIATDIAFALGVLGLVARRAPRELRAFMLTLAVVDDLATIAVIAIAYTSDLSLVWLATAAVLVVAVAAAARAGIRSLAAYVLLSAGLWLAVFESGIHATVAGVVLAFLTPAVAPQSPWTAVRSLRASLSRVPALAEQAEGALLESMRLAERGVTPLRRAEHALAPWSAYLILPLFALANAGVPLSLHGTAEALTSRIGLGIALGLVVGAPLGGILVAWLVVRAGLGRMPHGLDWPAVASVAPLKGIGFTIAIFISGLAFDEQALQQQATLAVLVASTAAALVGLSLLYARFRLTAARSGATTPE
jgi:NhaA family Na+:H+ antiporter